jgi:hypothetical protein
MEFCPVIFIGRERSVAHDLIGGLELTQIEQLAGENTSLAPPFIRVLERHGRARGCQHQPGCVGKPIVTHQPMNAAQRIAQILARFGWHRVEQRERLGRVRRDRGTGLHDREVVASETARGAHRSRKILGADALVHACPMVLASQDLAERVERLGFNVFRQLLRPPSLANLAFGAVAVALGKQDPRERKPALAARRLAAREATHRRGVAPLLPQSPFRAPAQQADARPVRVVGNECRVPAETRFTGRVAQDQPFDELLGHRIADRFFDAGCFASFALAHQIDRLLDRLHQLRRSCGCGGRWSLSDRR